MPNTLVKKMFTKNKKTFILTTLGFAIISGLVFGLILGSGDVSGANNASVTTKAYVWNTEPSLYEVSVTPSVVTLNPGSQTVVNCTGKFWDYNGWGDVAENGSISAVLYDSTSSSGASDDKNFHYTNASCTQCETISSTNGTCSCLFGVEYFANNDTWTCNMTIYDGGGWASERERDFNDSMTGTATIDPLIALSVGSAEIDFGNLSVTETSSEKVENITNFGNRDMNISVYGYGADDESLYNNLSMVCQLGTISADYERYSLNAGVSWDSMTPLTNASTIISDLEIIQRTNDTQVVLGEDVNTTFWKIKIPLSVGGSCNGTIVFSASDADA